MEGVKPLLLPWILQAKKMMSLSKDEFEKGMGALK
jgi:hypothetical protein